MRRLLCVLLLCLGVSLLSACGSQEEERASDSITGVVWQWQSLTNQSTGETNAVPDPEDYTILFNEDGTFEGQADCNAISGTYSIDDDFDIAVGPSTMAFCGEGSLDQLYIGLLEKRVTRKILITISCGGFSLIATVWFTPAIEAKGLCGLSGIAHGLMAYSGLELLHNQKGIWVGLFSFLLVFIKSIYEFISGEVVFTFMHMGLCGSPLAPSHLGGVVGGILSFVIIYLESRYGSDISVER